MKKKILFICKYRQTSAGITKTKNLSSGLLNSATFVNNMLRDNGVESNLVQVIDNNDIDRKIVFYEPDIVIIEALWVVPEKFKILHKLHPNVLWFIRLHSEIPFISNEGIALKWLREYEKYKNVYISTNSKRMINDLKHILHNKIFYHPNYYPISFETKKCKKKKKKQLNIGCFGSIRPMKNQLIQAVSAIAYAEKTNQILNFHINATRFENKGEPVLKNLRALFENTKHNLIEHMWMQHDMFIQVIKKMDLNMQVSLSETFNIVSADSVNCNVPVLCSPEIKWINFIYKTDPNDCRLMTKKINLAIILSRINFQFINKIKLFIFDYFSKRIWLKFIKNEIN